VTLPNWLEPLPDAALQRATDNWAIEQLHIPGETLMERAGAGLAASISELVAERPAIVICGKGNNGGDGFVVARLLREQGCEVTVLLLADADEYRGDAKLNLDRLKGHHKPFSSEELPADGENAVIIDAILGTGFSGEPQGAALEAINAINSAHDGTGAVSVIACDVPSGVDASTGEVPGAAVQADRTITFHASKPGLWIHPGKSHARGVRVIDIGIPTDPEAIAKAAAKGSRSSTATSTASSPAIDPNDDPDDLLAGSNWLPVADLTAHLERAEQSEQPKPAGPDQAAPAAADEAESQALAAPGTATIGRIGPSVRDRIPRRDLRSNKFSAGSVMICGGSRGLTGAPVMAAMAAARAGAGYVTVATPSSVADTVEAKLLEVMTVSLPDDNESGLRRGTSRLLVERADRAQALVLGPGLGRLNGTVSFAKSVARYANLPLVIDADALNALANSTVGYKQQHGQQAVQEPDPLVFLKERTAATVLTPHVGELARVLRTSTAEIDARRLHHVRLAAELSGAVVVLKGDDTLVASPDGTVAVSPGAAPALATAGTGDVLSGITGAFLAKGVDPFIAACAAVDTHLRAGRLAAKQVGPEGVIASDVIATIPKVLAQGPRAGDR
jgi:ADP-dependent NAD(P)H-hydrate dehydratase / NAD(P)H-hydrate epimerase